MCLLTIAVLSWMLSICSKENGIMAANSIPLPEAMRVSGDVSSNWDNFRAEFKDYSLATGLNEKPAAVQAATLRRVMGSECLHVYKHNLNLTEEQKSDTKTILQTLY